MMNSNGKLNAAVTVLLDGAAHPLRQVIELLRMAITGAHPGISENVKWNSPNYTFDGNDRVTMRLHPGTRLQLIFHRGAKNQSLPARRLIDDPDQLMEWKTNDRAVVTFSSVAEVEAHAASLHRMINDWIHAAKSPGQ